MTAALLLGTFLASIEVTVVAAAMPSIVDQLGGLRLYPWVFSAYLLTQTVSIPLYGRLADLYGRRLTYVVGVLLFLVGSALSGLAPSMESLVVARALQGLGAGSVVPLTMTIFGDLFEVSMRTKLQGLFSLVWGVSSVAGPLAGGAIVLHLSWRWVFYLNLPFGIISATVVILLLKEGERRTEHKLDVGGAVYLSLGTLLLLVGLLPAEQRPQTLPLTWWLSGALACYILFVVLERRHPEPLVPLDLFRDRTHVAANLTGVLLGTVLFGIVSFVPLFVQGVKGGTPVHAGAVLIPLSIGWTASSIICGRLVWRVGFRFLVRIGCSLVGLGSVVAVAGVWMDQVVTCLLGEAIYGFGMGACISSFTVAVQERVPPNRRGIATALTQFSRSIGGAVGVALLGAVFSSFLPGDSSGRGINVSAGALGEGLWVVFQIMALLAVLSGIVGIILFPRLERVGRDAGG